MSNIFERDAAFGILASPISANISMAVPILLRRNAVVLRPRWPDVVTHRYLLAFSLRGGIGMCSSSMIGTGWRASLLGVQYTRGMPRSSSSATPPVPRARLLLFEAL